jgi:hypothetical protein|tara:strand:- start:4563 stop:6575 length:2013 start_codon:yes stop_codon:yes gene_type:complete
MDKQEIMENLPTPLCTLVEEFRNEEEPRLKISFLVDCFEWIIKWHSITTLSYILERNFIDLDSEEADILRKNLAKDFRKPSLGHWLGFYRDGKKLLIADHLPGWLSKVGLLTPNGSEDNKLPAFRNEAKGHGSTPKKHQAIAWLKEYEPALDQLLGLPCLQLKLVVKAENGNDGLILQGSGAPKPCPLSSVRPPYFLPERTDATANDPGISLWPLVDYCAGIEGDNARKGFFYFNSFKRKKIERFCYEFNTKQRINSVVWEEFTRLLPIEEWRRATLTIGQREIDELTDGFVGRLNERQELLEFCLNPGKNVCLVTANPGSGKSTLMAALCRELADRKSMEGEPIEGIGRIKVFGYFISGGMENSAPEYFLRKMIKHLEWKFNLNTKSINADRVDELSHDLRQCLEATQLKLEGNDETLVIVIDGLDVSSDIHEVIPKQMPTCIKLICSSRPGQGVEDEFWENRNQEQGKEMELGPLTQGNIREILDLAIRAQPESHKEEWIENIEARSEGNPLYLKMLREELDANPEVLEGGVEHLPRKIDDLWDSVFSRLCDEEDQFTLRIMRLLAISKAPITDMFVAGILNKESVVCEKKLGKIEELLQEHPVDGPNTPKSFFHYRLTEWIQAQDPEACKELEAELVGVLCAPTSTNTEIGGYSLKHLVSHIVEMEG